MKKILSIFSLLIFLGLPACAAVTPDEMITDDSLTNHGYSPEMSRLIQLQNAQINNKKFVYDNKNQKWYEKDKWYLTPIRNIFIYLDPALDNGKFMQENIHYSPSVNDL